MCQIPPVRARLRQRQRGTAGEEREVGACVPPGLDCSALAGLSARVEILEWSLYWTMCAMGSASSLLVFLLAQPQKTRQHPNVQEQFTQHAASSDIAFTKDEWDSFVFAVINIQ